MAQHKTGRTMRIRRRLCTFNFFKISAIAILIPKIPVLNGNDPCGWSVIGFIHS